MDNVTSFFLLVVYMVHWPRQVDGDGGWVGGRGGFVVMVVMVLRRRERKKEGNGWIEDTTLITKDKIKKKQGRQDEIRKIKGRTHR